MIFDGNTLPIIFIRFNPDAYKIDGGRGRVCLRDRYQAFLKFLNSYEQSTPFQIKYMYYDTKNDSPVQISLPEYPSFMREFVLKN